ncbi:hypothetical protein VTO73DRAFT_7960 [Trametes versicolor]
MFPRSPPLAAVARSHTSPLAPAAVQAFEKSGLKLAPHTVGVRRLVILAFLIPSSRRKPSMMSSACVLRRPGFSAAAGPRHTVTGVLRGKPGMLSPVAVYRSAQNWRHCPAGHVPRMVGPSIFDVAMLAEIQAGPGPPDTPRVVLLHPQNPKPACDPECH